MRVIFLIIILSLVTAFSNNNPYVNRILTRNGFTNYRVIEKIDLISNVLFSKHYNQDLVSTLEISNKHDYYITTRISNRYTIFVLSRSSDTFIISTNFEMGNYVSLFSRKYEVVNGIVKVAVVLQPESDYFFYISNVKGKYFVLDLAEN